MAVTADKVVVELELKDGQYLSRVRANERAFTLSQDKVAKSAENAERRVRAASGGIASALKNAAVGIAAGVSVTAVTRLSDSYTRFTNQLKVAGLEGRALGDTQEQLFQIAQKYGTELESLGTLYGRLSGSAKELGADTSELLKFTEAVSAAVKIQGGDASQASGALLQLSQALGGGTVRAEEFNSVLEGARPIVQAVADNLEGYGGSVSRLKVAVDAGKVSSQAFFDALIKAFPQLEAQAEKATLTISASFQTLNNALGKYVGEADESLSATERLSSGIKAVADNLDTIIPAITAIAGLFATRYVAGLIASGLATDGFITKSRLAAASTFADEQAKTAAVAAGTRARVAAYTAESIALRAQVDTGRNAAGQFVSRARSAEALAVANRNLASSIGPATVATVRNTGAVQAATVGAKALGSGLLALAGGPIGLTILAVAALASAVVFLNDKYGESAVAARELAAATEASDKALGEYEKAQITARDASGESAKAARDNAAAMREEAQAAIVAARALAAKRTAEAQVKLATASAAFSEATSGRPTEEGAAIGQLAFAAGAARERDAAQARAGAAIREQIRQEQEFSRISAGINLGGGGTGGGTRGGSTGGGRARSGPDPDQIAEARRRLEDEAKLIAVRATGNETLIKAEEERQRLAELTAQYQEAGYADAAGRALEVLANENQIVQLAEQKDRIEQEAQDRADRMRNERERALTAQQRQYDLELEIARARGDDVLVKSLEREAELRERIAAAVERYGPIAGAAIGFAQQNTVDTARAEGEIRADADLAASTFVDALRSGDVWESLGQRFADAAANNLQQVLSQILQALASSNAGGNGFFGDALKFAANSFGGGRALGGPVRAGFSYDVGENGREKFVAPANGYIVPNMATANARSAGGGAMSVNINLAGANGDATIQRIAMQAARVGTAQAISQSRQDTANDKRLSRYRMGR